MRTKKTKKVRTHEEKVADAVGMCLDEKVDFEIFAQTLAKYDPAELVRLTEVSADVIATRLAKSDPDAFYEMYARHAIKRHQLTVEAFDAVHVAQAEPPKKTFWQKIGERADKMWAQEPEVLMFRVLATISGLAIFAGVWLSKLS